MTEKIVCGILDITAAGGKTGYLVIVAKGEETQRRKKIVSMTSVFPSEEEKARLADGESIQQILADYLPNP